MRYTITYHEHVVSEDIPKLSDAWKKKIQNAIEKKVMVSPEIFGKPLRRSLTGYRKLRVGDYRVIFRIEKKLIKVFAIKICRYCYV